MRSIGVGKNASSLGADLATMQLSDLPADSFSSLLAHGHPPPWLSRFVQPIAGSAEERDRSE